MFNTNTFTLQNNIRCYDVVNRQAYLIATKKEHNVSFFGSHVNDNP